MSATKPDGDEEKIEKTEDVKPGTTEEVKTTEPEEETITVDGEDNDRDVPAVKDKKR